MQVVIEPTRNKLRPRQGIVGVKAKGNQDRLSNQEKDPMIKGKGKVLIHNFYYTTLVIDLFQHNKRQKGAGTSSSIAPAPFCPSLFLTRCIYKCCIRRFYILPMILCIFVKDNNNIFYKQSDKNKIRKKQPHPTHINLRCITSNLQKAICLSIFYDKTISNLNADD